MLARAVAAVLIAALVNGLGGCSAPAKNADLAAAEAAQRRGDGEAARAAFRAAQSSCVRAEPARVRRLTCAEAYLGEAEVFEDEGRRADAAQAYEQAASALADDLVAGATAVYRAGRLHLELGNDVRGYQLLWRVVTHYPDEAPAPDALRLVVIDGRQRNPGQLYQVLGELVTPLARSAIRDNLLFAMANLAEHDLDDAHTALRLYDRIAGDQSGGLRDDARWHGARLARGFGDPEGAVRRLRALLATREVARFTGSYFSVWLDNAQLELGRVLRDDLGQMEAAAGAFLRLPKDYPDSILIDDALWEAAQTWDRAGDGVRTCALLARLLRDFPESRYELSEAPALRRERGCEPGAPMLQSPGSES